MPRRNLLSLLENFGRFACDVAVVETRGYRREKLTYGELETQARLWSRALARRGIAPGDRVLLCGANSSAWVACFWGILLRGAIVVPMEGNATRDFVARAVQDAGVKLVVRDGQLAALPAAPRSAVLNDPQELSLAPEPHAKTPSDPGERSTRRTIAQILYTSGTTGEPRGVVLTHGNFLANLEPLERGIGEYRKYERWFHPLRFLTLVPLTHVFGQFMALFVPPLLGAAIVFEPSGNPAEIMRSVKRERATAIVAVPRMLDLLKSALERAGESSPAGPRWLGRTLERANGKKFLRRAWMFRRIHRRLGWKFWALISGGAALAYDTESFFKRMGYAVVQGYGMTETASLVSLNHPFRATEGTVGKILPGLECRVADDGEILVRGENVAAGYWNNGVLPASGEGGWLGTGDLGEVDAAGHLRLRGRKKNVIVTPAGVNIYPEDLENALRRQSGVRDCVVIPFERGSNAEPCAVLLMRDPSESATRRAVEGANASLAEYQRITRWLRWREPEFPRTSTGKPRLPLIAARAQEILDGGHTSVREATSDPWEALLARFGQGARASGSLEQSLNLSSLDRVALMSELEERFHVELSETAFGEAKTLRDVEQLLEQPCSRRAGYRYPRWAQREAVRWLRLAAYYALAWPATEILGHPKIVGRENLRGLPAPVLVVSNHITRRADIGLILRALPRRFRHRLAVAMGAETLENMRRPPREWFFARRRVYQLGYWLVTAIFNVFPLPQFSGFRESFRFAGESVDRGFSVLVFPEGVVNNSADGGMAPFQAGIGLLAENLRIPVVPMRLDGVWQMKRERRRLAHLGEITVRIGAPVAFAPGTPPEEIARRLETMVKAL